MPSETQLKKILLYLFFVGALCLAVYGFFTFLFAPLLPLVLGFLLATVLKPLLNGKTGFARKLCAPVLLIGVLVLLCGILLPIVKRLLAELRSFSGALTEFLSDPETLAASVGNALSFLPRAWTERISPEHISSLLGTIASALSAALLPLLGSVVSFVPKAILFLTVLFFSAYYFLVDYDELLRRLPNKARNALEHAKQTGKGVVRAYGLLSLLTFGFLFVFFLVFGFRYAFLCALVIALVDVLPVLGAGTVLLPWAVLDLLLGSTRNGTLLLAVYAVLTIVKQVLEPKLVGKYIGLSPLVTLGAMYLGFCLFGGAGLLVAPVVCLAVLRRRKE